MTHSHRSRIKSKGARSWLVSISFGWVLRAVAFYYASDWLFGPRVVVPVMSWVGRHLGLINDRQRHLLSSGRTILFDVVVLITVLLTVVLLTCTESWPIKKLTVDLLRRRNGLGRGFSWPRGLAFGALFGCSLGTAIVLGLALLGMMRIHLQPSSLGSIAKQQLLLILASFAAGFTEEVSYRGYAQYALQRGFSFWPAALSTSLWFGWNHYGEGDPLIGALSVFVWGILSCLALRATGNLALSIGFHSAWNYIENGVFGVSDSSFIFRGAFARTTPHGPALLTGGSVGPEGSAIFFLANVIMIIVLVIRFARAERANQHIHC